MRRETGYNPSYEDVVVDVWVDAGVEDESHNTVAKYGILTDFFNAVDRCKSQPKYQGIEEKRRSESVARFGDSAQSFEVIVRE